MCMLYAHSKMDCLEGCNLTTFSEVDVSSIFIYPLVPRMVRINSMRQQEYYE